MQAKNLTKVQNPVNGDEVRRQKILLIPILEALDIKRDKYESFKFCPDQYAGLIIAQVKALQRENSRLKKELGRVAV